MGYPPGGVSNPAVSAGQRLGPRARFHPRAPGQPPGRAGFQHFFETLRAGFPDAKITPATLVADDEHVCVAYTLTGTHQGEFNGIVPTGRPIEVRGVEIGRSVDGEIVERWGSTDELGILQQLDVAPAPS